MADPTQQAQDRLQRLTESLGSSIGELAEEVRGQGLSTHGKILAHFKAAHGLGHGNANLLAHAVREHLAGGPVDPQDLLDAQYAGGKAALRPIYEALAAEALGLGGDVQQVIQKTGVSFRRAKQFALVQAPSSTRVQVGLNLPATPDDERVTEVSGMCSHRVDVRDLEEVDDRLRGWLRVAYDAAAT